MPSPRSLQAASTRLAPDSYKALCGICKDYSTCENRRSVKKDEATAEAGSSAYAFGYLGFSVRSRSFYVDISRPSARSDANLSDKTADGPLANPLEGKTVPRVKRGSVRDGGGADWDTGREEEVVVVVVERTKGRRVPPGRFLGVQLIGAPATPTFSRRRRRLIRMEQHGIPL